MSNIDPKIASHASMWLKNAGLIERQLERLSTDELEAYRYIRDIFKQPEPDMERLQVAQETLRDVGSELHDDFGAAVKNFAAKVSVIVKNFDDFRQAVTGGSPAADISEAKPVHKAAPKSDPKPVPPKPNERPMPEPPPEPKPKPGKQKVRIDGIECRYYYGYVNNRQEPDGEGEFHYVKYSKIRVLKGIFHDGKFPETGTLTDGETTFTGKFDSYYTVIEALNKSYSRISMGNGVVTTKNGVTIKAGFFDDFSPRQWFKIKYPDGTTISATEIKWFIFYGECIRANGVKEIGYIHLYNSSAENILHDWQGVPESKAKSISSNGWLIAILTAILAIGLTLTGYMNFITLILLMVLSLIPLIIDKGTIIFRSDRMNPLYFNSIALVLATLWLSYSVSWWNLFCLLPAIIPAALIYMIWDDK